MYKITLRKTTTTMTNNDQSDTDIFKDLENHPYLRAERLHDIIIFRYDSKEPVTLEISKEIIRIKDKLTNGVPHKMICVFPNLLGMDKQSRDFLSTPRAQEDIVAAAMVGGSALARTILKFFIALNNKKSSFNSKVFATEKEAIDWVSKAR